MELHDPPALSYPVVQDDGTAEIPNGPIEGSLEAEPGDRLVVAILGTNPEPYEYDIRVDNPDD